MANITKEELKKFKCINSGGFGTIYEHNGKVYKVYNSDVKTGWDYVDNPVLKHRSLQQSKIRKMMSLNDRIKYTDLPEDILYVDDKFQGIVMPYYDGETILNMINSPVLKKIALSRQMVRNAKELTENHIYTFDYKLINMIVCNGELKLIDLDDSLTKVTSISNPFYNKRSIGILDETIKAFFREDDYRVLNDEVRKNIVRQYSYNYTYSSIESYLYSKAVNHTYVLVSEDTDPDIEILKEPQNRVILVVKRDIHNYYDHIINALMKFKSHNVSIYEVIDDKHISNYFNDNYHEDLIDLRESKKLRLKK